MVGIFFRKCSITRLLFPLILALLCIAGCIEKAPLVSQKMQASDMISHSALDELDLNWPTRINIDFDSLVSENQFSVSGNIMLSGNGTLPYLMLNATLLQEGWALKNTKYLMLEVDSGKDYSFEITKNMRILPESHVSASYAPGSYDCILEVSGPNGLLASETRKCKLQDFAVNPISSPNTILPDELAIEIAKQEIVDREYQEEKNRKEIEQEKTLEDVIQEKESAEDADQEKSQDEERIYEAKDESRQETEAKGSWISSEAHDLAKSSLQASADQDHVNDASESGSYLKRPTNLSMNLQTKSEIGLIGSSTSKKYHLPSCRYASKIKPDKKISFKSADDAKKQGYLPCKVCHPKA